MSTTTSTTRMSALSSQAMPRGVGDALCKAGWFAGPGAHLIVDGQYGSTGKGVAASLLAELSHRSQRLIHLVTSNAGPNSGHTGYAPDGTRVVHQQLPIAPTIFDLMGVRSPVTILNGGAVIDLDVLKRELSGGKQRGSVFIDPAAAIIEDVDRQEEAGGTVASIASTGKGVGAALARKILRRGNVAANFVNEIEEAGASVLDRPVRPRSDWTTLVEVSQGYSLGINSGFYPAVTSRECTANQAIADARIPYCYVRHVMACYRTYPIRVGNTDQGNSGPGYSDQQETSWGALGETPELTTVTGRVRRVFTWSREQFKDSLLANCPDTIFLNFFQYIKDYTARRHFVARVRSDYIDTLGAEPLILLGYGPLNSHVRVYDPSDLSDI